jgi:hypothetical protein
MVQVPPVVTQAYDELVEIEEADVASKTSYEVIGDPPSLVGADQLISAAPFLATAATSIGAPGTVTTGGDTPTVMPAI